jgi:chromosome segregation ATPase
VSPPGDDFEARLGALSDRIADTLDRSRTPRSTTAPSSGDAEASADLQALRCAALEDRIVELEAALVGARDQRDRAEALAEASRIEADRALDELEQIRRESSERSRPFDMSAGEALQTKLLEIERLTRERDHLRRTCDELRTQARELRRERDESTLGLERTASQVAELRERDIANRVKLSELERIVAEQRRELEIAARRAKQTIK